MNKGIVHKIRYLLSPNYKKIVDKNKKEFHDYVYEMFDNIMETIIPQQPQVDGATLINMLFENSTNYSITRNGNSIKITSKSIDLGNKTDEEKLYTIANTLDEIKESILCRLYDI